MVGANNKILTVSYGTFSCTLEGFDEPFNTMRAIAEYFRDLAADDRYFGAEPPTPDAEMLHKIAEREIQRRVEAKIEERGLILRPADRVDAEPESIVAETAQVQPTPSPVAPEIRPEPATEAAIAPEAAFIAPVGLESVAEKLKRIRSAVAHARAATIVQDDDAQANDAEPVDAGPEEAQPEAESEDFGYELDISGPVTEAELDIEEQAEESEMAPVEETADEDVAEEAVAKDVAPEAEPVEDEMSGDAAAEVAETDEAEIARHEARIANRSKRRAARFAALAAIADEEARAQLVPPAAEAQDADEALTEEDTPVAFAEADAGFETLADESFDIEDHPAEDLIEAADEEALTEGEAITEDTIAAALADIGAFEDISEEESAEAETAEEILAETQVEPEDMSEPEPLPEELPEAAQDDALLSPGLEAEPMLDQAEIEASEEDMDWDLAETALETEAETFAEDWQEDAADLAADDDDLELDDDGINAEAAFDEIAEPEAEVAPAESESAAEAAPDKAGTPDDSAHEDELSRLMRKADSQLSVPENRRRFSAITHLKAAVAATVADRLTLGQDTAKGGAEEDRSEPYREDLSHAVRPRRPVTRHAQTVRPESATTRQAPLVLVSAQRVDRDEDESAAPAKPAAVRPRRISAAQVMQIEEEDQAEPQPLSAEEATSFAEFADSLGTQGLSDLLEAAAAYTAGVEGRPHFSPPQIMRKVTSLDGGDEFTREDRLRVFGKLLRQGKIAKVKRGQYAITEASRYWNEAKRA